MKSLLILVFALFLFNLNSNAQVSNYYQSNAVKILQLNGDTISTPFTGGFIAPQFSEIDLNGDAYMDLFVFDREGSKVLCFLNLGIPNSASYRYAPKYNHAFPKMTGWVLLRDFNCDGKMDIFTSNSGSQIRVFKNTSQNGILSFALEHDVLNDQAGDNISINQSDIPAIADLDGDGDLDIMGFPSFGDPYFFRNQQKEENLSCDTLRYKIVDYCWGSFREGFSSDINLGIHCYFPFYYKTLSLDGGNTMLTLDLDDDGDQDLIMGHLGYPNLSELINGKSDNSWYRDTMISSSKNFPHNSLIAAVADFPATYYIDVNNDGKKDFIVSNNATVNGQNLDQNWLYTNSGKNTLPVFNFQDSGFLQNTTLDFGANTVPSFFDADGDGDDDLVLCYSGKYSVTSNKRDQLALFLNDGDSLAHFQLVDIDYLNFSGAGYSQIHPHFVDMNADGKKDLLLGHLNGKLSYFQNSGTAQNPQFTLISDNFASIDIGTLSSPAAADINGDSLIDLVIGTFAGPLAFFPNTGTKTVPNFNATPAIDTAWKVWVNSYSYKLNNNLTDSIKEFHFTGNSTPVFADLDGDDFPELICGSENGEILIYAIKGINPNDSIVPLGNYLIHAQSSDTGRIDAGRRSSPALLDMNNDGKLDFLVGTSRGGLEYYQSSYSKPDTIRIGIKPLTHHLTLSCWPNPATNMATIQVSTPLEGVAVIECYDITGQKLQTFPWNDPSETQKVIDISSLPNGTYLLRISTENEQSKALRLVIVR